MNGLLVIDVRFLIREMIEMKQLEYLAPIAIAFVLFRTRRVQEEQEALLNLDNENDEGPVEVRAALRRDGREVAQDQATATQGFMQNLLMKVPPSNRGSRFSLRIEGNSPGTVGGTLFEGEKLLEYSPQFMTILIHINKPVYNGGQTVYIRVVLLSMANKPFDQPIDIYIVEPRGFIVHRWPSKQANTGVAEVEYQLPNTGTPGEWTVRVQAGAQIEENTFRVEKFWDKLFETFVTVPNYVLEDERILSVTVEAGFSTDLYVRGNASVVVLARNPVTGGPNAPFTVVDTAYTLSFIAEETFEFSLDRIRASLPSSLGAEIKVVVSYFDEQPLETHRYGRLQIVPSASSGSGNLDVFNFDSDELANQRGVAAFSLFIPEGVQELRIRATYEDPFQGGNAIAELIAYPIYTPPRHAVEGEKHRYIQILSSTKIAYINEFVVFHLRMNFAVDRFFYAVIAKGLLLVADEQAVEGNTNVHTFAIPVSAEMGPSFRIVAYVVTSDGEIIADSLTMPFLFRMNQLKDFNGDSVEAVFEGETGARICLSASRQAAFNMFSGNEMTRSRVTEKLHSYESYPRSTHKVLRRYRGGEPDEVDYFPSGNYGPDANRTFDFAGLIIFTDGDVPLYPGYIEGLKRDAAIMRNFRLERINRYGDFYDDGDAWGWQCDNIRPGGKHVILLEPVPKSHDTWVFNAFAMSAYTGLGMADHFVEYQTTRLFYMNVMAPSVIRAGEQVGIRVVLLNNLRGSPYYKFVHVEPKGVVSSYNPRTSAGDHQHLVLLRPEDGTEVYLPVVPTVPQGSIDIVIEAVTQIRRDEETVTIEIAPEGVEVGDHTSLVLDLRNRGSVYKFLDIGVEESPIVPYQNWRRFIYGSPAATLGISGDVVGPAFPEVPVGHKALLRRASKTTDHLIFNFASNLLTLKYLRLTNQFNWEVAKSAFTKMSASYAGILHRYVPDGGLKFAPISPTSVWLTQLAVRYFHEANFPEWENFIFIDPKVISRLVEWILKFQMEDGSFRETTYFEKYPLMNRISGRLYTERFNSSAPLYNITLTAHVLITLDTVGESLQGTLRGVASNSRVKALRYLEAMLPLLENEPYALSVTALALSLNTKSRKANSAFALLHKLQRRSGKKEQEWDALSVETTSYALRVYMAREAITLMQQEIVDWLNTQRQTTGGFIEMIDTLAAIEALTEYSWRTRLRDITNMVVTLEATATPGWTKRVEVGGNATIAKLFEYELQNVWGHVNVKAEGAGMAVLQLDYSMGIDDERQNDKPPVEAFDLKVHEYYLDIRNKSHVAVEVCPKWINLNESLFSGAVTLEAENPSGYFLTQGEAVINIVRKKLHPYLVDMRAEETHTHFFFSRLGPNAHCFNYTLKRWHPVANLTRFRMHLIYETYQPERFQKKMFNSTALYALDICTVCGSYQCPYCPYYSVSSSLSPSHVVLSLCLVVTVKTFVETFVSWPSNRRLPT
ncbi:unnamed protein product [Cyprideis torosa]|uniref:Uncharacterized protein n=1 Tax=Cyprideis torosa TaxID=163714 RepID=A0A7R8WLX8_9CRUS|nr:unnamed protein product [Cyprideis torosa]CAG0898634.1 unnamed protein product [Cyprideis torosa]